MAPSKTRKRKSDQDAAPEPGSPVQAAAASTGSKRQKKLPVRAKDGESAAVAPSLPVKAPAKGHVVVFDEDDEAQPPVTAAASDAPGVGAVTQEQGSEGSSDDDDAPETISAQQAASQVKKSTQTAQKAAQEQAAAQKRKRQERDALFKQQAAERKKAEEETKAGAKDAAGPELPQAEEPDASLITAQLEHGARRRRADRDRVPDILPADFLTDSSSDGEDEEPYPSSTRPKRRDLSSIDNAQSRQNRAPRDARVGSTVYRVAKKTDQRLAPKVRKDGQNMKHQLLKRNRSVAKPRSGFFTKR